MTATLVLTVALALPVPGWASQYGLGVMPRVVVARQGWGQLPANLGSYDGFVARPYCDELGDTVYLRREGRLGWERFLVADCGCPQGRAWMLERGILVEVDFETAARWGTAGRGVRVEMLADTAWQERQRRLVTVAERVE